MSIHNKQTDQVIKIRGQHCGDVDLTGYLQNVSGPVPLVLDLRITHERFGSSSDPSLNGNLHCPSYRLIGNLTVFLQIQEFVIWTCLIDLVFKFWTLFNRPCF